MSTPLQTSTMRAIQVSRFGGPEVFEMTEIDRPDVPEDHALISVSASGINYADTHKAENAYLVETKLPYVPGLEVVGTREDGTRVVAIVNGGGYAEYAVAHEAVVFPADGLSDEDALALVLQGNTALHLLETAGRVQEGESIVVHAAAGGVGTLLVQLGKAAGAYVIAAASTPDKRALATELGADAVIDSRAEDLTKAIREANGGRRVDVVFEMVGGSTFSQSFDALAPWGRLVTYGMAGREPAPPVDPARLMHGSKSVIGFWLDDVFRRPQLMRSGWKKLTAAVADGSVRPVIGATYPLADVPKAHEDLRGRGTVGKLVLRP
jgi:NADPH2:quinone reductase